MNEYVLQVGEQGFDRLKFLNGIFGEHSRNFLIRAGLKAGASVLELGCGTGSMTAWLAGAVGEAGSVIAVDASKEQIEIAKRAVENSNALTFASFARRSKLWRFRTVRSISPIRGCF